uniref:G_PROTEIN_RECEP_F1_2 domain-containing protein n=1 Tax=Rhabditophanes sp. KR3021 TaxID=114890 RepID=A0AC35TJP4_9BILA
MGENETCHQMSDLFKIMNGAGEEDYTENTFVQYTLGVIYATMMIIGFIGNGGVILTVLRNKRLRSARNIFLMNLMVTDLILCSFSIPVTYVYAIQKQWWFKEFICKLTPLVANCPVFVSSWSLCAIAMDKFIHIIDPIKQPVSAKQAGGIIFMIWLVTILINVPAIMSYVLIPGSNYKDQFPDKVGLCHEFCIEKLTDGRHTYGLVVFIFQFIIPMAIITYCYWRILHRVARDSIIQNVQFASSLSSSQKKDASNRNKRVNYILISMVGAFLISWLPISLHNLSKDFNRELAVFTRQPYFYGLIFHVIAMMTVVWNPFLFFYLTRKQKQKKFTGLLPTSEVFNTIANGVNSFKSNFSRRNSLKCSKKSKNFTIESELASTRQNSSSFLADKDNNNGSQKAVSASKYRSQLQKTSTQSNSAPQKPLLQRIDAVDDSSIKSMKTSPFKRMHSNAV